MAVEIATLKPLFPGGNEVDQVWRVCEIMGSPGSWVSKSGQRVGGGEWKDGIRLAQKLGFSFPKMAPHSLETILPSPQWPASLAHFVTWCLMWDPKVRPTSRQALEHDYFTDAFDPLIRPKSSGAARVLGRKGSTFSSHSEINNAENANVLATKSSSWFRKSLGATKENVAPPVPEHIQPVGDASRPAPTHTVSTDAAIKASKSRPVISKRATWSHALNANVAPIPILPSVRPISPVPDTVNAQAATRRTEQADARSGKKIGRQLSVNSQGNHYAEIHRQEAERALNGANDLKSPAGSQKESFFSHLRKRARRLSGRHQTPISAPNAEEDTNMTGTQWNSTQNSNRHSLGEPQTIAPLAADPSTDPNFAELDRALQSVRCSLDVSAQLASSNTVKHPTRVSSNPALKRHASLPGGADGSSSLAAPGGPISSRTRRSLRHPHHGHRYETPDEEDEYLDEVLANAHTAATHLDHVSAGINSTHQSGRPAMSHITSDPGASVAYLTPSPSKDQHGVKFGSHDITPTKPMNVPRVPPKHTDKNLTPQWPTPPYDESDWASQAAASIIATQASFR